MQLFLDYCMKIISRIHLISNISGGLVDKDLSEYFAHTYSFTALWKSLAMTCKCSIILL